MGSFKALLSLLVTFNIIVNALTQTVNKTAETRVANGCDVFYQFEQSGQTVLLQSPGYPGNYGSNLDCRYTISSPPGTQMTMNCNNFNVEYSTNCAYDVLFVSTSGDTAFRDQEFFCGQGTWSRTTKSNQLAIGFHTDETNPVSSVPFRFQCQITVTGQPQQPTCSCGVRNIGFSRIVGGTEASVGEFPWRVSLYTPRSGVFCGGTIISRNYILTAAHCTNAIQSGETIYVNVGDHDLSITTDTNSSKLIPVDYVIQNTLYNDQTQDSDISLLRLQTPLDFTRNIAPVCLPWKFVNQDFSGQTVTASGWGTNYFGGKMSNVLMKVDLPVIGNQQCSDLYSGSEITINNNKLCTYYPGRDTCQGDSGGSIDYRDSAGTGNYYAIGVTSEGISCGQVNQPGVYTKIANYLGWIQGNTGETFCKA